VTQNAPEEAPTKGAAPKEFLDWLRQAPVTFPLITAAVAATMGLFAPEALLPEPLQPFRSVVTLIVALAFLSTWTWRKWLLRRQKAVLTATAVILVLLSTQRLLFVRPVQFTSPPPETKYFLIGTSLADPGLAGMTDEDIIKTVGQTWSDLRAAWGTSFVVVAVSYALTYVLLVNGVIMSVGSTTLSGKSVRRSRVSRRHQ
jgi:hypothetical protein